MFFCQFAISHTFWQVSKRQKSAGYVFPDWSIADNHLKNILKIMQRFFCERHLAWLSKNFFLTHDAWCNFPKLLGNFYSQVWYSLTPIELSLFFYRLHWNSSTILWTIIPTRFIDLVQWLLSTWTSLIQMSSLFLKGDHAHLHAEDPSPPQSGMKIRRKSPSLVN